jgi:hypothetical protein
MLTDLNKPLLSLLNDSSIIGLRRRYRLLRTSRGKPDPKVLRNIPDERLPYLVCEVIDFEILAI